MNWVRGGDLEEFLDIRRGYSRNFEFGRGVIGSVSAILIGQMCRICYFQFLDSLLFPLVGLIKFG